MFRQFLVAASLLVWLPLPVFVLPETSIAWFPEPVAASAMARQEFVFVRFGESCITSLELLLADSGVFGSAAQLPDAVARHTSSASANAHLALESPLFRARHTQRVPIELTHFS